MQVVSATKRQATTATAVPVVVPVVVPHVVSVMGSGPPPGSAEGGAHASVAPTSLQDAIKFMVRAPPPATARRAALLLMRARPWPGVVARRPELGQPAEQRRQQRHVSPHALDLRAARVRARLRLAASPCAGLRVLPLSPDRPCGPACVARSSGRSDGLSALPSLGWLGPTEPAELPASDTLFDHPLGSAELGHLPSDL